MDNIDEISFRTEQLQLIKPDQAWHYKVIPETLADNTVHLYIDEGCNQTETKDELEILLGKDIRLQPVKSEQIGKWLSKYYVREQKQAIVESEHIAVGSEDFLISLIREAKNLKSSDIHIEIYEHKCRVRIRIDGMMIERYSLSKQEYPALINKIKIMSNLDIAEKRLPQDGRINFHKNQDKFDIRVSVLPTLHGEKVVLRLLSTEATNIELSTLGFSSFDLENYLEGVKRPNGILLISGPTGSGKTTTLYATLKLLNKETRNVLTIEDPIEYTLEGINQVQLKESIGLSFAAALRNFLRQDPDVIMVGEIRDVETANMAIRAALTGHLVLSTIHTNSAWGTVSRLIDMGVPPFLVANTLNTSVAQRLLRLLCPHCKQKQPFSNNLYPKQFKAFREVSAHYLSVGCDKCYYTGYKGRKAVYEVIPIDAELSNKIKSNRLDITESLSSRGVKSLAENAFELFETGETTLEEIYPLLFNF
ncbi:GspE/PulE family protein [Solitalea canadensis]|uniref:Type II secretory pathway, ATPase PulE/Tfp pilus assembly pathway, ATPase PilB n=1 Tax=Solitalea canadensis (strain ATCC 29591 / DSM 3403 / JCM 21819 / LMG 8368 / NBRC 15130 / NCIMB 12057 / USAM 9D) TaxID=929556 RepID=H8KTR3_SOLCM|nr:GspE/PulE family protein [Solitalea canadensis]AFD06638.1 type II secretory pathway, ATPase PulE/Tfp pilus assembly pathway, ATPase PilB [Solitalea canadensis DSM 3403]